MASLPTAQWELESSTARAQGTTGQSSQLIALSSKQWHTGADCLPVAFQIPWPLPTSPWAAPLPPCCRPPGQQWGKEQKAT